MSKPLETASQGTPTTSSCCGHDHVALPPAAVDKPFTDPVCGMKAAADPAKSVQHAGVTYYFCGQRCVEKFRAAPEQYLAPKAPSAAESAASKNALYTCPMHPEVQQIGPGTCPKCGMALEPMDAATPEDTSELDDMSRRFWISLALSLPLLFITMSEFIPGLNLYHRIGIDTFNWLQALLATPVVLWGGWPFFVRAWASFKS